MHIPIIRFLLVATMALVPTMTLAAMLSLLLLAQPPTTGGIATPDRRN